MLPGRRQDKKKLQPSVRFTHCWTIVEIIVCRHHTFFQGNKWVQNRLYRLKNGSPVKFYLSNPIKWRDLLDEGFFTYPDFSFKHLKNQRKTPDSSFQQILFYCDQSSYVMVIFAFFSENFNCFAKKTWVSWKTPENCKYVSRNSNISFFAKSINLKTGWIPMIGSP